MLYDISFPEASPSNNLDRLFRPEPLSPLKEPSWCQNHGTFVTTVLLARWWSCIYLETMGSRSIFAYFSMNSTRYLNLALLFVFL